MKSQCISPCQGCRRRELGCHISCKAYQQYREARDELLERRAEHGPLSELIRVKRENKRK